MNFIKIRSIKIHDKSIFLMELEILNPELTLNNRLNALAIVQF